MFVTVKEKWVCQQGGSVTCKLCVCNSDFENGQTDGRTDRATARSPIGLKKEHISKELILKSRKLVAEQSLCHTLKLL